MFSEIFRNLQLISVQRSIESEAGSIKATNWFADVMIDEIEVLCS
jgi:hypothetical protein